MEWLTIILSSLLALLTPTNLVIDKVIEGNLLKQVKSVDTLEVRVDNIPTYQVLKKVDRIRIASRGIEVVEQIKIALLEVETDPINLELIQGKVAGPVQAAVRMTITEADLQQALKSKQVQEYIEKIINRSLPEDLPQDNRIIDPQIEFLGNNQIALKVMIPRSKDSLDIKLSFGLKLKEGRYLELVDPTGSINNRQLSNRLLKEFAVGINSRLDLDELKESGILVRILQWEITEEAINIAAFVRVDGGELNP